MRAIWNLAAHQHLTLNTLGGKSIHFSVSPAIKSYANLVNSDTYILASDQQQTAFTVLTTLQNKGICHGLLAVLTDIFR